MRATFCLFFFHAIFNHLYDNRSQAIVRALQISHNLKKLLSKANIPGFVIRLQKLPYPIMLVINRSPDSTRKINLVANLVNTVRKFAIITDRQIILAKTATAAIRIRPHKAHPVFHNLQVDKRSPRLRLRYRRLPF